MDGGITGGVEAFNKKGKKKRKTEVLRFFIWSGKRGSNSRPIPWQGIALPAELFPHAEGSILAIFNILSMMR